MTWLSALAEHPDLRTVRERLTQAGGIDLTGLCGSARLLLPLLSAPRPFLVVTPHEKDLERLVGDLTVFAAEAGLEGQVAALPSPGPPYAELGRHPQASLRRAAALHAAQRGRLLAMVASPAGLLRPSLSAERLEARVVVIEKNEDMTPEILLEALTESGYTYEDPVTAPGQMALRGGILDVFPPDQEHPVRVEFFGDTIESLRVFDPGSQRSHNELHALELLPLADLFVTPSLLDPLLELLPERFGPGRHQEALADRARRGLADQELAELVPLLPGATQPPWEHLGEATTVVLDQELVLAEAHAFASDARRAHARRDRPFLPEPGELLLPPEDLHKRLRRAPAVRIADVDTAADALHVACRPLPRYAGDLRRLTSDLAAASGRSVIFLSTTGRADRLKEVLLEDDLAVGVDGPIELRVGALSAGFELTHGGLRLLADADVFPEEVRLHGRGRRAAARSFLSDFRDLAPGDLVVHEDHGVGRFGGLEVLEIGGGRREFMVLVYQGGDKLKVPVDAFDRVQRYTSAEGARPPIDRLGGGSWEKVKRRVKRAMRDMAAELLRLYARRKACPGHAFSSDSPWLGEFDASFEYEETPGQAAAIADVAADMQSPAPMDRLVCGDVGYGKTEVAMRAAMRAVLDGKQVAVLAPTTVLAFQHWQTFRERFAPFPVLVEMVSRFRNPRQTRATLAACADGKVDVLIGTHRLLSKDVVFKDLGLLVIDEEQRFGVAAKERLKHLRASVDCLTLSATPIPRTLQMGLFGLRDMSVIETPPKDRLAIQTSIVKFSTDVIAAAVREELARDGQVYIVHNRVASIYSLANLVARLVPEARLAVAHGQMPEAQLEKTMLAFVEARANVLVCTTIIENGLDIPQANTLIVNRADRYGLAQLYQLRGRVGRSDRRAAAYLLVPPDTVLSELARKRLAAIREFSELGAGFRVAALDLELRGAGNLLGGQQSGHIHAVGFDLYVKLLEQTILELQGEAPREAPRASLNLKIDLRIPDDYVPEARQRMSLYKRVSQAQTPEELAALSEELRDRYGPPPRDVHGLLAYARTRLLADGAGIRRVDRAPGSLRLHVDPSRYPSPDALVSWIATQPGASLAPDGVLSLPAASDSEPLSVLEQALGELSALSTPAHTL